MMSIRHMSIMHLSLNVTPKQRNSDYLFLLHGRWEIGGSVGTANKKQIFFIRVGAKLMGGSLQNGRSI